MSGTKIFTYVIVKLKFSLSKTTGCVWRELLSTQFFFNSVSYEVPAAVYLRIPFFWDTTPRASVVAPRLFETVLSSSSVCSSVDPRRFNLSAFECEAINPLAPEFSFKF